MKNMNRKLLFCITAAAILQPLALQAKIKKPTKNISPQKIIAENPAQPIESSYFLQITLAENDCEKALGESCIFRDKMFSAPYLHETTLTIISNKIFATQFFNDKTSILQVKDGSYILNSNSGSLISFNTKNGEVSDLKLLKGDLNQEKQNISKCSKAENFYNFYSIYKKDDAITTKSGIYKDEYDFKGLNEYILFADKNEPSEIMAVSRGEDTQIIAMENIQLCKMNNSDILNIRHLNAEECLNNPDAEECSKYEACEDIITVENCDVTLFKEGF